MNWKLHIAIVTMLLSPAWCFAQSEHEHEAEATTQPAEESQTGPESECESKCERAFFIWPEPAKLEGPISTDRPGFPDSAFLVPRGHAVLELGYGYAYDQEKRTETKTQSAGNTALRVGLLDDLELRVKWSGMSLVESKFLDVSRGGRHYTNHQHDDGATDMSVGFKLPIMKHSDAGCLPNLTLIPALSLPTGGKTKTSGDVDPSLELAWNYPITDKLSIYGVGSIASISDGDGRYPQAAAALSASYAISSRVSVFVEYFGIYPSTRNTDCQHNVDGGTAILITDDIQLDVAVGMGLNEEAPDFFANVGVSFRF